LLTAWEEDPRRERVGLVGLGAGALAAYAQTLDRWTFFEIDPAVIYIARDSGLFTYLKDSKGEIDIIPGDARLTLQQTDDRFGLLIIDAFGSDAIPLHLLTREAMDLYQSKLKPDGVLAVHISNRYVDLEPVLAGHAAERGWTCLIAEDRVSQSDKYPGKSPSVWAFMATERAAIGSAVSVLRRAEPDPGMRTWTDDYTNLLRVLRLKNE
jgi:spermidine synthase